MVTRNFAKSGPLQRQRGAMNLIVRDASLSITSDRSEKFVEHLYKEKEIHKEHRHKHLLHKLFLSSSFFGIGQFSGIDSAYHLFLYIAPFIALIHDVYIFSEDYKVKRVGVFFRNKGRNFAASVCKEELAWEDYVSQHREKWAYRGSFAYSLVITVFSCVALFKLSPQVSGGINLLFYSTWVVLCIAGFLVVFKYATSLEKKITKLEVKERLRGDES